MQALSTPVYSTQSEIHPRLDEVIQRHLQHADQTPIAEHSLSAWPDASRFLQSKPHFVLDLGCGTGVSTHQLAQQFPDAAVLGVDRSVDRLSRSTTLTSNALVLRFDQFDLLRLCAKAKFVADKIVLLYPNPSPKPEHLRRRWHAHPIWPCLLMCTRAVELRTNWEIYAREFACALQFSGIKAQAQPLSTAQDEAALTRFEAKYRASGHALWQVCADVPK
jgi:tRNA (guanine-N7-)-methyltransferase